MKKKVLIISLVAALVLGVLGLNAMAETERSTVKPVATALWTDDGSVTVNGTANEANWIFDSWIRGESGTPKGSVAKLWNGTDLYFAVKTDGATSLKATLNTHVINVTLGATPSADLAGVTVKQSGDILEMKVPFASIGFAMHGYTQKMPMVLELTNGTGTSKFDGSLTFGGEFVTNITGLKPGYDNFVGNSGASYRYGYTVASGSDYKNPSTGVTAGQATTQAQASGQIGARTETVDGESVYHLWNKYQAGKQNYMVALSKVYTTGVSALTGSTGTTTLDFDVKLADLPECGNPYADYVTFTRYMTSGFGIGFGRVNGSEEVVVSIANKKNVGLVLYVQKPGTAVFDSAVLNRQVSDDYMHVSIRYGQDLSLAVVIDDVQVYYNPNVGNLNSSIMAGGMISFELWNPAYKAGNTDAFVSSDNVPKSSAYDSDVYLKNVKLGTLNEGDQLEELTFDDIKGTNSDPSNVSSDLTLPSKLADPNGKFSSNLQWTSNPAGHISATGKVTPPEEMTEVVLTATVAGTNPAITKSFNLTLSMPPIDAWKADAVTMDGNVDEYYNFARGAVLTAEAGKPAGKLAARWTKDTLYIGAEYENTEAMAVMLGDKVVEIDLVNKTVVGIDSATVSVGTGTVELALPLSALNLNITKETTVPTVVVLVGNGEETFKSLLMGFYGASEKANIDWVSAGGITVDGKLNEGPWQLYRTTSGRTGAPAGMVGQLWNGNDLYLAINAGDATSLKLTVADKVVEIADLSAVPASCGVATNIAKDGNTLELKIPMDSFYTLTNYGQSIPVTVELTNATATSGFFGDLTFVSAGYGRYDATPQMEASNIITAYWGGNITEAVSNGQIGYTANADANGNYTYRMWNKYVEGKTNHAIQQIYMALPNAGQMVAMEGTIAVDFDVCIADMPAYTDPTSGNNAWRMYQPVGLGINLGRYSSNDEELNLAITNMADGLVMFVGYGPFTKTYGSNTVPYYGPYKLGKQVGDKFHVTLHYTEDGKIAAFVDDIKVMDFVDGGFAFSTAAQGINFNLWSPYYHETASKRPAGIADILNPDSSPKNSGFDMDVEISNVKLGNITGSNILELLTFDTIKNQNVSPDLIMSDLILPTILTDGRLSVPLTWVSSKEEAISASGVVNTDHEGKVTLTAKLAGQDSVSKKFNLTVNPDVVDAWKGSSYTTGRGFTFKPTGNATGTLDARWDDTNLYLQLTNSNATKFAVAVGGKSYSVAVADGKAEIKAPLADLGLGEITNGSAIPMDVVLTGSAGNASKRLQLSFFGAPVVVNTNWDETITVNGTIDEGAWQFYHKSFGRTTAPVGKLSALWGNDSLYLGINTENVQKIALTLNGKKATLDLATMGISGIAGATAAKSENAVEIKIPFSSIAFKLVNYGQTLPALIELEGQGGVSGFAADLTFTAQDYEFSAETATQDISTAVTAFWGGNISEARANEQVGFNAKKDATGDYTYRMWNKYVEGKTNHAVQQIYTSLPVGSKMNALSGILSVDMDVCIEDMPVYTDPTSGYNVWRTYQPVGLGIGLGRYNTNDEELNLAITNMADGLVMFVGYGPYKRTEFGSNTVPYYGPFKLDKQVGDEFHLSFHYTEDGQVSAYVDDVLVMEFQDGGFAHTVSGSGIQLNLWSPYYHEEADKRPAGLDEIMNPDGSPKNSGFDMDVSVGNVKVGTVSCYDLRDLITFDLIKGLNGSPELIEKNLTLPTTVSDGNKLSSAVVWSSSNAKVITNTGVVTTQDKNVDVKLTAKLGEFTKAFDLTVVLPVVDAWRITSANVNGTLAEYDDFARGYTFPNGTVNGSVAARWNKNTLYLAGKTNGDTMTVTLGGKTITANLTKKTVSGVSGASVAVGSGTVELGIPMSQLKLGTISQGTAKPMVVTFAKGSTKIQKQLSLTFYGVYETSLASWNDGTVEIDGILDEDWLMYTETTGRTGTPNGVIGKMWNGTDLFLAVDTDGASKMLVTMNSKTATIDLTADPVADASGLIQAIAKKDNIVEMKISYKDFFTLVNYGQVIDVKIELENEVGVSGFDGGFEFTSREHKAAIDKVSLSASNQIVDRYGPASNVTDAEKSGQIGYTSTSDENGRYTYHLWNMYQAGKKNYAVQSINASGTIPVEIAENCGTLTIDFDVQIDDMPVYKDPTNGDIIWRTYQPAGLGIAVGRGIDDKELSFAISNTADGLVLYVGHGPFTKDYGSGTVQWDGPHKLNKALGQEFHVMVHYTEKGEMAFYVDDELIYKLKEVGQSFSVAGGTGLGFTLWTPSYAAGLTDDILDANSAPKSTAANTDIYISDVRIGESSGTDILDNITYETIQNLNGDADSIVSNLKLPSTISDGKITAKLAWTSSNRGVITNAGTVYPPDERTPVTMTVSLVGAKPAITKQFPLTAVMPFIDTWQANFVKIDGDLSEYYSLTRGYSFAKSSGKPSASIAAGWNTERSRLYYAIKYTNTDKITITMGSKVLVVDLKNQSISGIKNAQMKMGKNNTVEISVPLEQVRITEVKNNMLYDIGVKLENAKSSVSKNLTLAFYGQPSTALASWDNKTVVLDGKIEEQSWLLYTLIQGRPGTPEGSFGRLWNGTDLYVAVDTDGAKKMTLLLGEKTLTVDLSKATPTASGMSGVKVAKDGDFVELKIPMKSFGFTLHNYTETLPMKLELSNAVGVSGFYGVLQFSSREAVFNDEKGTQGGSNIMEETFGTAENVEKAEAIGQIGYTAEKTATGYSYHLWNIYQEGKQNYPVQNVYSGASYSLTQKMIELDDIMTVDFDVRIDDMPEYKDVEIPDTFFRRYQPAGLGVFIGRELSGEEISFVITNEKKGLALYMGSGPFDDSYGTQTVKWDGPYYIGKELGEQFHVSVHQTVKGEVQIYINDQILYEFKDVGADFSLGSSGVNFNLWSQWYAEDYNAGFLNKDSSPKNSLANSDVTVSNVQLGTATCYDLLDYLDFDYIKGNNGAYDNVVSNLELPSSLTDGKLKSALTWESNKPDIVDHKGKVTTQSKDSTVILKASLKGTEPVQYKELEVSVALPPVDSWYNASVALDGNMGEYHNFTRGYDFVKVSGKPTGSVGAAWDTDMMYVGIKHTGADSLKIKIEGKTLKADLTKGTVSGIDGAKIAVGDKTVELAIPKSILKERALKEDRVDMVVTLIQGENETEKGLRMSFYGETQEGIVGWGGQTMTVDGKLTETAYQLYGQLDGRMGTPEGLVAKVWSGKDLYLAIFTDDAKTMQLTLNGKTATINPNTLSRSGDLKIASIAKGTYTYLNEKEEIAKGTLLEMKISFANFGFDMYNYGLTADMSVEMTNAVGVSAYNTKMAFTNKQSKAYINDLTEPEIMNASSGDSAAGDAGMMAGSIGGLQTNLDEGRFQYHMWNLYNPDVYGFAEVIEHYSSMEDASGYEPMIRKEGDWYFDLDIRVDKMLTKTSITSHAISNYGNDGLDFWLQRGIKGQEMIVGITQMKDIGLVFTIRHPETTVQMDYPIHRELGETFHLSVLWEDNGDVTVYIDDEKLCFVEGGALGKQNKESEYPTGFISMNLISDCTWNPMKSDDQSLDVTVSNILTGFAEDDNLFAHLSFDDFKGENRRITEVWKNMPLPKVVTDGVITSDIVWESSDPAVISIENGVAKVTPQDEDVKVTLTARMKGNKDVCKTFEVTVTCPIVDAQLMGTAKTESYKLSDGSTLGARWDKDNIYLDITGKSANGVDLTFGDKKITVANGAVTGIEGGKVAVSGSKATITLPRTALGITIPEYHATERFTVAGKALKLEFVGYESIADEYLKSQALKDFVASLKKVEGNITLPQTYTSQFVDGKLTMEWSSDTLRVLDNNGQVKRPSKVDALVRLSLMVDGKKLATFDANIIAEGKPDMASTTELRVPFGKDIKIDGSISEQGWSMNSNLATADAVIGKMGVQWDTEYLYMAFQYGKAKSLTITLEGKTANINIPNASSSGDLKIAQIKKGSYLELKIALKDLGLTNIIDYGEKIAAKVMLDGATFDGTFTLTSVQWFATDNPTHRFPGYEDGLDVEVTGWTYTDDGYYFYDEYQTDAENLPATTAFRGFVKNAVEGTEIFAPMEQSGEVGLYAEFDFQSLAMPIYEGGMTGDNRVGSHTFLATTGFTWQLGGYANKEKKTSEWISMGIYNSEGGLAMMVRVGRKNYYAIPLGKQNGDMFRIGMAWEKDDTLLVFVDGELIYELENAVNTGSTMNNGGIGMSFQRSKNPAACDSDSFRINVSNVAMGYYYGECVLDNIEFDTIRDENINYAAITMDLDLMDEYATPQISSGKLTWESSDPAVAPDGTVTRPEDKSYALTRLTVTNELGHNKEFITAVKGFKEVDDVLFVKDDYDIAHGVGQEYLGGAFMKFDQENQSVIRDLKETKRISVVKFSALEHESRMDQDTLTLWVSEDNQTYTQVKDFKILHKGNDTYLYGFNVEARYVKVHTTHFDNSNILTEAFFPEMVNAYYEEVFGDNGSSFGTKKTVTVKNSESVNMMDMPWTFTAQELGIVSLAEDMADVRIFCGDELLYHYAEDGMVTVRIPEVASGGSVKIKVLSGNKDAMDISNKEGVYEVLYGTREMFYVSTTGVTHDPYYRLRCMVTLPDGTIITTVRANSTTDENRVDCRVWLYSTDHGRSWKYMGVAEAFQMGAAPGGFVYDHHANILYSSGYHRDPFDRNGLEVNMMKLDLNNGIENAEWEYVGKMDGDLFYACNYNDGTVLSTYDGDGPNVDMIYSFNTAYEGESMNETYTRVSYTTDAGNTWVVSESKITIPGIKFGFESGVSESSTLELDDGTIVVISRFQDKTSKSFCYSYSTDHGITWADGVPSEIYSVNTQPLFLNTPGEFDLVAWAGNNILGGESYQRYPQNLAIPVVEEDLSNIKVMAVQNTYQRFYFQNLIEDSSRNTNLYLTYTHDGALLIDTPVAPHVMTRVDDYENYITKTKGSYDSFENSTTKYEGWCDIVGTSLASDKMATDGKYSMQMFGQTVRSVPYFRTGSVSFDLNWNPGTEFKLELETTFSRDFMYGSPAGLIVDPDGNLLDSGGTDTGIDLQAGWNEVAVNVDLPGGKVTASANGSEEAALSINPDFDEYVTYIALHADNYVYVDNFTQTGEPDDVKPASKDDGNADFDLTAILLVGVPVLVVVAAVALVLLKKKAAKSTKKDSEESAE